MDTTTQEFGVMKSKTGVKVVLGALVAFQLAAGAALALEVGAGETVTVTTSGQLSENVTVHAGGRLVANAAAGLTGAGALTFEEGSILEIQQAKGFSGPQASNATVAAGTIVRLNVGSFGSATDPLNNYFIGKSPVFENYGGGRPPANPLIPNTTVLTLNKDANGVGGILTDDGTNRTMGSAANGVLVIGPNGGVIAATSNMVLTIDLPMALGTNALTIGATNQLDGVLLSKLGTVKFSASKGQNTALPGSSITILPGASNLNTAAHALPDAADLVVNGSFQVWGSSSEVIGSLAGSGRVNGPLSFGVNGNNTTFGGILWDTAGMTKTGAGRMDLTNSAHTISGQMTIDGGTLALSGEGKLDSVSGFRVFPGGALLLDNSVVNSGDRTSKGVTLNGGTFRFRGMDSAASTETLGTLTIYSGLSTLDVVNGSGAASAVVTFTSLSGSGGTANFTASNGTLGAAGNNPRVLISGKASVIVPNAFVGGAPAWYDATLGFRAFTLADGTEFNGEASQTALNTVFTAANAKPTLNASRKINTLWIDSPGSGKYLDMGAYNLTNVLSRILLTGNDDFEIKGSGTLTMAAVYSYVDVIGAGRTLTLSPTIVQGRDFAKGGEGTLVLNGPFSISGPAYALCANAGILKYGANGDIAANTTVRVTGAGVFDLTGKTDSIGALYVISGMVTNSVGGGTYSVTSLNLGPDATAAGSSGSKAVLDSGSGTLSLGGNVTYNIGLNGDMATIAGNLDLGSAIRTFMVNDSVSAGADVDLDIPAVIGSATAGVGLSKAGTGVLRLRGANTFDGLVDVTAGTLILGHSSALGAAGTARTVSISNNMTMAFEGGVAIPSSKSISVKGFGDEVNNGPNKGALFNLSGNNSAAGPITLTGDSQFASQKAGDKLTLSGGITGTYNLTVEGSGDTELSGVIGTGAKSLTKNGSGRLTLSGNNTYGSVTTVNGGELLAHNAIFSTGTGLLTVNAGATLSGTGTVGAVSIAAGGTLGAGSGAGVAGTLTTTGSVTMLAGATLSVHVGTPATSDKVQVNGAATVRGTVNVAKVTGVTPAAGTYVILKTVGTLTNGTGVDALALGSVPVDFPATTLVIDTVNKEVRLELQQKAGSGTLILVK